MTWKKGKGIYEEAMKEYFLKNERFLKEQAGILAGGLEEGTPCRCAVPFIILRRRYLPVNPFRRKM